jgi:hypothetical protein
LGEAQEIQRVYDEKRKPKRKPAAEKKPEMLSKGKHAKHPTMIYK